MTKHGPVTREEPNIVGCAAVVGNASGHSLRLTFEIPHLTRCRTWEMKKFKQQSPP